MARLVVRVSDMVRVSARNSNRVRFLMGLYLGSVFGFQGKLFGDCVFLFIRA